MTHVLDDARGQVEEGKTSADWALVAREHTMRTLLATGYFTADDLETLGMPEQYRRSVHGLVTAFFRGPQPYMDEVGRRKSERPERKGAKNTIFRITEKGRRELPKLLVGLGGGDRDEAVVSSSTSGSSPKSGETGAGVGKPKGPQGIADPLGASTDSPDQAPGALTTPAPGASTSEPVPLPGFPEPPKLLDLDQRAA